MPLAVTLEELGIVAELRGDGDAARARIRSAEAVAHALSRMNSP